VGDIMDVKIIELGADDGNSEDVMTIKKDIKSIQLNVGGKLYHLHQLLNDRLVIKAFAPSTDIIMKMGCDNSLMIQQDSAFDQACLKDSALTFDEWVY
jgi:hypothetical protein